MKSILLKSFLVSSVAVVAAYAMIIFLIPLFGEEINPSAWFIGAFGPYAIGMPLAIFCYRQADRLAEAHEQLIAAHEELHRKSRIDPMTGMLNRETFLSVVAKRLARNSHGVLVIADADNFKLINDTYGHLNGDTALRLMAEAILVSIREDDLAGRIGGEEFALYLSGASAEQAAEISERVRRTVEAIDFQTSCGFNVRLTISAGAARGNPNTTLSDLMRNADRSLYEAKRAGRNRVIFHQDFREAA